jgi:hypothetical protein
MAGRASRRRCVGDITDSEITALPDSQVETFSFRDEQDLFTEAREEIVRAGQSTVASDEDKQVDGDKDGTAVLLNCILEALLEDRLEKEKRDRQFRMEREKRDEHIRMERRKRDEQFRIECKKRIEAKLDQLQDNFIGSAENLTTSFRAEIDKEINEVEGKLRKVNSSLSESAEAVRKDSHQRLSNVHEKINTLHEDVM